VGDSGTPKLLNASKVIQLTTKSKDFAESMSCSTTGVLGMLIMSMDTVFKMIALMHVLFGRHFVSCLILHATSISRD
jgi:hypothetical protein